MKASILYAVVFSILLHPLVASATLSKNALSFAYNVKLIDMKNHHESKILDSLEAVRDVIGSEEFKEAILKHRFLGQKKFANNSGFTNLEIYHKIIAGAERLNPEKNNMMDLEIELFSDYKSNTVGYTWTGSDRIFINKKYFEGRCSPKVAGSLVHEWLHKLGFRHDVNKTRHRRYSVPYAVGSLVVKLAHSRSSNHRH
jgi:hypothetical protein